MKAVITRLRRLERGLGPQSVHESERLAGIIRERRRRHMEASGQPFVDLPREGSPVIQPDGCRLRRPCGSGDAALAGRGRSRRRHLHCDSHEMAEGARVPGSIP
jgi:hypothetical protein